MSLPLPNVVADTGPGGGVVTSMRGINALTNSGLENQYAGIRNKYAPYNMYADALSKIAYAQYLPYQLQAQALSNPLLWMAMKDNPEAAKEMMSRFSQSVPNGNNMGTLPGGAQLPNPSQSTGNSLLSMLIDKITGGNSGGGSNALPSPGAGGGQPSSNALTGGGDFGANNRASDQEVENVANGLNLDGSPRTAGGNSSNALLPSAQGGVAGVAAKMTAPYTQSPYKEGSLIPDPNNPGQFISVPTGKQTTQLQNQLAAAQRTIPQLKSLGQLWEPFMTAKGKLFLQGARVGNLTGFGNSDLPSKYVDAKLSAFTTVESYLKSIGVPVTVDVQKDLKDMLEPYPGENAKGYSDRIEKATQRIITDFVGQSVQQLGGGYQSNTFAGQGNTAPAQQAPQAQAPAPAPVQNQGYSQGAKAIAKGIQLPDFESKEQFQAWFSAQPKVTQDAVRIYLGKKK